MDTKTKNTAIEFIKKEESFKPKKYRCSAKKWTIGYGHVILKGEIFPPTISESTAYRMLVNDIQELITFIDNKLPKSLTSNQQAALVSFTYNIGIPNFKTSGVYRSIMKKAFLKAADNFRFWNKVTNNKGIKVPCKGLTNRRLREKELYLK